MRARTRAVPFALTALAVAATSLVAPLPAAAAGSSLSGTVTGPDAGPLGGVCVDAQQLDGDGQLLTTLTDGSGGWSLEDLPAGDYAVAFNACEDRQNAYATEYFDDAQSFFDATILTLTGTSARTGVDASLAPSGAIAGRVTDDDTASGVEGVCVLALGNETGGSGEATTDASGGYRIDGLSPGGHLLFFSDCTAPFTYRAEMYDDVALDGTRSSGQPSDVLVASGETTTADAGLLEGGAVTGTVTAAHTGRRQALICVGLHPAGDRDSEAVAAAVSGFAPDDDALRQDGSWVLPGVTPGSYTVAFADALCGDDGYTTSWYDGRAQQSEATPIDVVKGQTVEGIAGVVTPRPSTSFVCEPEDPGTPSSFRDVSGDNVHRSAIECMNGFGVLQGRPDGSYGPAEAVRRGQLATLVVGVLDAAGVPLPADPPDAFDDDAGHPHETSIDQLADLGLLGGKGERRFAPDDTVERGQLATVLVAAYTEITGWGLVRPEQGFDDDGGSVHEPSIDRAALAGLAAGTGPTTFDPAGAVRRDAVATFLARLLDRTGRDTVAELPLTDDSGDARTTVSSGAQQYRTLTARR